MGGGGGGGGGGGKYRNLGRGFPTKVPLAEVFHLNKKLHKLLQNPCQVENTAIPAATKAAQFTVYGVHH